MNNLISCPKKCIVSPFETTLSCSMKPYFIHCKYTKNNVREQNIVIFEYQFCIPKLIKTPYTFRNKGQT